MGLEAYKKKRNFSKTPEPAGKAAKPNLRKPLYMVHDHYARHHHHDLRLEMNGVLKSWAIPKLIDPKNLERKALAVQTEDHPLAYGHWEGEIPEGSYGAGKVKIWDTGTYKSLDYKKGKKLIFCVQGKKLKGDFVLLHFRPGKEWLFFKKKK